MMYDLRATMCSNRMFQYILGTTQHASYSSDPSGNLSTVYIDVCSQVHNTLMHWNIGTLSLIDMCNVQALQQIGLHVIPSPFFLKFTFRKIVSRPVKRKSTIFVSTQH